MYTLKFLDSESFDKLPYNKASTSLGIADRNRMEAYVRDTANPMDAFTAMHELEHLKGDDLGEHESPDEDGVYYKGSGPWVKTLGTALAPLFGPFAPLVAGGSQIGGHIMEANNQGKSQNSAMLDQQRAQQSMMSQFQSQPQQAPNTVQTPQAPNTIQTGGFGGGEGLGGGRMSSDLDLIRRAQQKGNHSGRGGGF